VNYYRRYVGDFQADTMHLSMMEQGAYDRLLDYYYATERPIPPNSDRAAMICRAITLEERAAVTLVLETYFERATDGWRHKRVEKELQLARDRSENASEAGKAGAEARWGDGNSHSKRHGKKPSGSDGNSDGSPLSNHHSPTSKDQPPDSNHQPPETPVAQRKRRAAPVEAASSETRKAYEQAYENRYGVLPTWNRKTSAQLAQFVESVPRSDAPAIAAWFVRSNRAFYVSKKHPVGVLLSDAPALRTEWLTGRQGTETEARQADRATATGNAFAPLIEQARAKVA
jgi:uncharacterized protein YdaU (DUF1376 family)